MALTAPRPLNLLIFLFVVVMLGIGLYMEHAMGLEPCPMCVMQRALFLGTGLVALIAFLHGPGSTGRRVYAVLTGLFALAGAGVAGRQIWLQGLPEDQVPLCGPSLDYMLDTFPLTEVLAIMFSGDGNCAEVVWQDPLLGLSIPHWSLVAFVMLAAAALFQLLRRPH